MDFLRISLAIAIILAAGCIIYATYYFIKVLKSFENFIEHADNVALGIKDGIKLKALASIPALLIALVSKIIRKRKGGE